MSLTVRVTCDRCGEVVEASLAMKHWCRRLTPQDVEALIEKFLDDLTDRSGFKLNSLLREMIRADWRVIAQLAFKDSPSTDHDSSE
jgi:hypothetical protein